VESGKGYKSKGRLSGIKKEKGKGELGGETRKSNRGGE
jgi:hypothetical protein